MRPPVPSRPRRRVLILLHARDAKAYRRPYQIWGLRDEWEREGLEVVVQRGLDEHVDADAVVNHVDLTVLPPEYAERLRLYPAAINAKAVDLSKRRVSEHLVGPGDGWDGPVIVKTDLNCGGMREAEMLDGALVRRARELVSAVRAPSWRTRRTVPSDEYLVLDSVDQVPKGVFENPRLVVEKFLPEREGDLYVLRNYTFFGDRYVNKRLVSPDPVVKSGSPIALREEIPVHPDVIAFAARFHLDRGKVDYVVRDGRVVVYDLNRTPTLGPSMTPERRRDACARLAPGLFTFL